ncbi:hypothetical protein HID58_062589, partial [Brassica napus]
HDAGDAFVPPAKVTVLFHLNSHLDVHYIIGTASAPLYAASTASPGVSKSGEYNVQLRADIRSMQTQGHRGLSPDPPPPSVPHTNFTDPLPSVSQSDTVPDVSGVVNQILSDAGISKEIPQTSTFPGDVVGGQCQSSNLDRLNEQKLPHPSPAPATVAAGPSVSSKFVSLKEKETTSHGGETHGSNPVEEASELGVEKNDDVDGSSNPSPTKF